MTKHLVTILFLLLGIFSLANDHKLNKENHDQHIDTKIGVNHFYLGLYPIGILTYQMDGIVYNSDKSSQFSWVSKTISLFGNGFNLAGLNVQMNKLNLKRGSGWVHKKEWNLHADEINNGLSLRYKF